MITFLLGFYDGDGTLSFSHTTKSIYPRIISSDTNFLNQVKKGFSIDSDIKMEENEVFDYNSEEMFKTEVGKLYLGLDLFIEMMKTYKKSLERKRFSLKRLENYGNAPVRRWLKQILPREKLIKILKLVSPNKIADILGIKNETVYSFIKVIHNITLNENSRSYYNRIQRLIISRGDSFEYFEDYQKYIRFLKDLGKYGG
jgi:hypothetical protein